MDVNHQALAFNISALAL